jgi:transposase
VSMTGRNTEIIVGIERRRKFAPDEKIRIVEESFGLENSVSQTARKYGIQPAQIYIWRKCMKQGQMKAVEKEQGVVSESEAKALQKRISELEKVLGRKTLENEILKEAIKLGREKKLVSREPLQGLEDFQ